ncbi:hypothetical protein [Dyella ginsengisoli]|uniref:hypothetical protein n=1 Tax=Dyella ginsengisoli TaxID=363848 RepID=UPI00036FB6C9|nr:hypothetical protein [Dyella ginsengisoli]
MNTITFDYLAELTQRAWRFAQNEWPQLPREAVPVFELKTNDDRKKQGIGYDMTEMKGLDHAEVISHVIYEVSIFATLMRGAKPEQVEATFETLVARINEATAAEAAQSTKH